MTQGLELDTISHATDTISEEDFQNAASLSNVWIRRAHRIFGQHSQSHLEGLCWTMTAGKDWADEPIQDTTSHWSDFAGYLCLGLWRKWWRRLGAAVWVLGTATRDRADPAPLRSPTKMPRR